MFEKLNVAVATFDLQLEKVMVQNSFHPKISFRIIEFLLILLHFTAVFKYKTKVDNNQGL